MRELQQLHDVEHAYFVQFENSHEAEQDSSNQKPARDVMIFNTFLSQPRIFCDLYGCDKNLTTLLV